MCKWYQETLQLVREEKFSQIERKPHCGMECDTCSSSFPVEKMFIEANRFSPEAQAAAIKMKAEWNGTRVVWILGAILHLPPVDTLRSMIEAGLIQAYDSFDISLVSSYLLYRPEWWREAVEYLFSQGCSIDIQDPTGRSLVLTLLINRQDRDMLAYLLERGADLLLADKSGQSGASYIRESAAFTDEEKERYLRLV